MSFDPKLNYGDEIDNKQLRDIFKCSPQGGMRKSNKTNTLVLISVQYKKIYEDRWKDDTFYYTGMGLEGDQEIGFMQNNTLAESDINGVDVFLFEVYKPKIYSFAGKVQLAEEPFREVQKDINNNQRLVWIFPLRLEDKILDAEEF